MKTHEMTFTAKNGHVSTSGKLIQFLGRNNGGIDMYANIQQVAEDLGYIPDEVEITISITPTKNAEQVGDVLAVVPRTQQNRFSESKVSFEELNGFDLAEYAASLLEGEPLRLAGEPEPKQEKPKAKSKAKATTKTKAKARTTKTKAKTSTARKTAKPTATERKAARTTTAKRKATPERGTAPGSEATSLMDTVANQGERMDKIEGLLTALIEKLD